MNTVFSSISGQFSKALILGAFFPTALFAILGQLLLAPLLPAGWLALGPLDALDPQWRVVALALLVAVLSGLLHYLSVPITRFYEGYTWERTLVGQWRVRRYKTELESMQARYRGLNALLLALPADDPRAPALKDAWNATGRQLNSAFSSAGNVLPTRLGNVIRSFEDYPDQQYGMEAITLWPRLSAKIDREYAAAIDDARTGFDFLLNSSALSALLALALLVAGLLYGGPAAPHLGLGWAAEIGGLLALAYGFYLATIGKAGEWGELVRGAFDLYRGGLLQVLGHQLPADRQQERDLWGRISLQMIYGDATDGPRVAHGTAPRCDYDGNYVANLELTRGLQPPDADGAVTVVLRVRNADSHRAVRRLRITDTPPEGFVYLWDSARVDGGSVAVSGIGPYHFALGDLLPGQAVTLIYCALKR